MRVCGQEFTEGVLERIRIEIKTSRDVSRSALSRRVCEWLDWRRANGKMKEMSCRVALLKLERRGLICLPESRPGPSRQRREELPERQENVEIRAGLKELGKVEVVPVRRAGDSVTWKSLMDQYHYLKSGPLCGAQMRYLIKSERYGWMGGMGFSSGAWALRARDTWIGWNKETRQKNLEKVICNSRFLIVPWVKVPHLASHVLSLSTRRIAEDWLKQYGVEPVLIETFVDRERFIGTSYRAANWINVGSTQGRGRQDSKGEFGLSKKDVYVYPLRKDGRNVLCRGQQLPKLVAEGRKGESDWAEEEFGGAEFGDERLRQRLCTIARDFYDRPQANIPQACGSRARAKAAYRFLDHRETTMDKILRPHYESTLRRIKGEKIVLAVQDTTSLNYSTHPATEGLGTIGYQERMIGLNVHDTMAFSVEGTPLGLLDVQSWVRDPKDFGKKHRRHELPIEEKESYKWLKSFKAVSEAQKRIKGTTFVSVGDREADIYELFYEALRDPSGAKTLIRAEQDRLLRDGQGHLWAHMEKAPVLGIQILRVPRRGRQPGREAQLEVHCLEVGLTPPRAKKHLQGIAVWAIFAREINAPEEIAPLQWMLLSTVQTTTFEEAAERLRWYALRWGIEVYHRTLKSGCKVEQRQLGAADRIEACLSIDMVVAWRIYHLTKLGRETPDVPCTVFFEDAEWKALVAYKTQKPASSDPPPSLREAIHMVAGLGGFLGRKCDGEPGTQTLWLGLQRLDDLAAMWTLMSPTRHVPHPPHAPVSRKPGYG